MSLNALYGSQHYLPIFVINLYTDDTFIIWHHGQEKLREFLKHLNGLHKNTQFTMEKEEEVEGHLPFMDIEVYRATDSSLGYRV
jgi:hypothetical protein